MPELPEVETIRRGLNRLLPGKSIVGVVSDTPKSFPNSQGDVKQFLIGAKIIGVKRRGKVLMIDLDSKYTLVIHLKMTGQLVYVNRAVGRGQRAENNERWGGGHPTNSLIGNLPDQSTRVIFCLKDGITSVLEPNARKKRSTEQDVEELRSVSTGASDTAVGQERWQSFGLCPKAGQRVTELFFNDQRKFGWIRLLPTAEVPNIDFFKKMGPEPLNSEFTRNEFAGRLLRRKNTSIKAALLDQSVVAGIGNIYADESLWGAKIHPSTLVKNLSTIKLNKLFEEIQYVLKLSIDKGGSTDKNYVNAEGKRGSYLSFARVFRREGQDCPRCGMIIDKIRVAGRGTHICPKCQKTITG